MLNLHRLLFRQDDAVSYHAEILPTERERLFLTTAKNAVRDHLRTALSTASTQVFGMEHRVEPRFRTQGSWSYRTCLQPAHLPPQEMDWDFGVYLPATLWQGTEPGFAAKAYFELVERALTVLCRQQGWQIVCGPSRKDTCIRIQITTWCHMDVCLYAAPENQFRSISEIVKSQSSSQTRRQTHDAVYLAEDASAGEIPDWPWDRLDQIMLAMRTGEWKPSDPHNVYRWYNDAVEEHTEQLRRVCCYLKGWRDHQWPDGGGPSSLLLMICATEGFLRRWHRDDIALQDAAERVSSKLRLDVYVPGIDKGAENFNRLNSDERMHASQLADGLRWAIHLGRSYGASMKDDALLQLRKALGSRVPMRADFIDIESPSDQIRSTPATVVAAPAVRQTKAG